VLPRAEIHAYRSPGLFVGGVKKGGAHAHLSYVTSLSKLELKKILKSVEEAARRGETKKQFHWYCPPVAARMWSSCEGRTSSQHK